MMLPTRTPSRPAGTHRQLNNCVPRTPCFVADHSRSVQARAQQQKGATSTAEAKSSNGSMLSDIAGLGDALGPIGLTYSGEVKVARQDVKEKQQKQSLVELGPIGMTLGPSDDNSPSTSSNNSQEQNQQPLQSIAKMTTAEWRAKYEKDGMVDLWVEEEFNAGSRLVGGRDVHNGGVYGFRTGEGPSAGGDVAVYKVKIYNHYTDSVIDVEVPEDRYILWEAEDHGLQLPWACRMGCCTACAVRIKEGEMYQPEALGISMELREKGYGLMCVGFPSSDMVLETVSEDEVYELQFGQSFASQALNPTDPESIERDDFALSIANMDE